MGADQFYAPIYQRDYVRAKVFAPCSLDEAILRDVLTVKDHVQSGKGLGNRD